MKYFVIAKKWSDEYNKQINFIAGTFEDWICAKIFADAYAKHYSTKCEIVENLVLINQ